MRRSHDAHQIREGDGGVIVNVSEQVRRGSCRRSELLFPAQRRVCDKHKGLSVAEPLFDLDRFPRWDNAIAHCAMNLRHAAQAVGVLHARIVVAMRIAKSHC